MRAPAIALPFSCPQARKPCCNRSIDASRVLVDVVDEVACFGRSEVDMVGGTVPASDADREPTGAGAEFRLALGQCAQRVGSRKFRHGGSPCRPRCNSETERWPSKFMRGVASRPGV